MYQILRSKTKYICYFNLFLFFLVFTFFEKQIFAEDVCDRCCERIMDHIYYPVVIDEKLNLEKMIVECRYKRSCEHIFCEKCMLELNEMPGNMLFGDVHNDDKLIFYPICYEDFNKLATEEDEIYFEKALEKISRQTLFKFSYELCNKGCLDKALTLVRLIPSVIHKEFGEGDSYCSITSDYTEGKNNMFLILANSYIKKNDMEMALEILDMDIDLSILEEDQDEDTVNFIVRLSDVYEQVNNQDKANELLERAFELIDVIEIDDYPKNMFYLDVSAIYFRLNKESESLQCIEKALQFAMSLKDPLSQVSFLQGVFLAYAEVNKDEEALDILEDIEKIAESIFDDTYDRQCALLYAMRCYVEFKKTDKVLEILSKALQANTYFLNEKELYFITQFNDCVNTKRLDQAIQLLDNSMDLVYSIFDIEEVEEVKDLFSEIIEYGSMCLENKGV